jgi:hypothetical protein
MATFKQLETNTKLKISDLTEEQRKIVKGSVIGKVKWVSFVYKKSQRNNSRRKRMLICFEKDNKTYLTEMGAHGNNRSYGEKNE